MGCLKLSYHLSAEPRWRCVYNAAGGENDCAVYPNNGNIQTKTGLGDYSYSEDGAGPHALTGVQNTDGLIKVCEQEIEYNSFNKAV